MKPYHGAPSGLLPARGHARTRVPVLIQVPALPTASTRRGPSPVRRRRRLRREVRVVGSALLIGMTTTLGLLPMWGGRTPGRVLAAAIPAAEAPAPAPTPAGASAPAESEPIASLSAAIEPAAPRDLAQPVVLYGIILPDDGAEEATHGGD